MVKVPELLLIPDKLIPILDKFNEHRYFLLDGGRGGGKSQTLGRFILYLGEKYKLRIVCGREIQNSIQESVYSLLVDLIRQYQLDYDIQTTKITHRETGTTLNFRGFREQGAFNIQGMEGVDITWIDEAQAITKTTLDVLIPTIRKENAKIFFSMNRHVVDDPVFEAFSTRKDCLHIHINYDENPFCTKALIKEAQECKAKSSSDYDHIWLGIPLDKSEDALFSIEELLASKNSYYEQREGYTARIAGFDIARYGDDKCATIILHQKGALHWAEAYSDEWQHKDLNYTTGRILMTCNEERVDEAMIDEDGMGAGPLDSLSKGRGLNYFKGFRNLPLSFADNKAYANRRTEAAYKTKELILKGHLQIKNEDLMKELTTIRYTYDHYQRRILVSKDEMRKKQVKSPNLADALFMAVSLIGEVKQQQDTQYFRQPVYAKEGNLFSLGGIR